MSNANYNSLLRQHVTDSEGEDASTRKRRRVRRTPEVSGAESSSLVPSECVDSNVSDDSDDFEDVELEPREASAHKSDGSTEYSDGDVPDYSFLDRPTTGLEDTSENITIAITRQEQPKNKRKVVFVTKEERHRRVLVHQWCIMAMVAHGVVRNRWCNHREFLVTLRESVSSDILEELTIIRRNNRVSTVNAVRFTDVVRSLMLSYSGRFRVSRSGLVRKNWNELEIPQANTDKHMTFSKFMNRVSHFQGSRDVGAQGFVALCRSLGMKARLVFSLQPPDFGAVTELPKIQWKHAGPASTDSGRKVVNSKQAFLQKSNPSSTPSKVGHVFPSSSFPLFWTEVWNKYNKKWLCVDPIVLTVVERPPMRRKSSFEPPMADKTNNLVYAIAFDAQGGVKDVTRRYAQQYNSKTVKKRISNKSESYFDWYAGVLSAFSQRKSLSKSDILELKEFRDRDLAEGMPNNAAGFKDHPMYALESQLRQNEYIYPMDDTTKCGTFRFKSTSKSKRTELVPVFKRSAVHILRSPKAWHLRGRVLRMGVQPLKIKQAPKIRGRTPDYDSDEDGEEESITRLYAEFQTQLYIPPSIIDGKIVKNAYGNVDIYVPTMIPEGGYLFSDSDTRPVKLLERAARILEIDYSKAIVAFDFGKKDRKQRGVAVAREGGVLVATEYKEAMELVVEQLEEDEQVEKKRQIEMNSLRNWKFFLTKLRVMRRLEKRHGQIDERGIVGDGDKKIKDQGSDKKAKDNGGSDADGSDFSVYSEDEGSEYEAGGFVPTEMVEDGGFEEAVEGGLESKFEYDSEDNKEDGGFDKEDTEEGGFDKEDTEESGFGKYGEPEEGEFDKGLEVYSFHESGPLELSSAVQKVDELSDCDSSEDTRPGFVPGNLSQEHAQGLNSSLYESLTSSKSPEIIDLETDQALLEAQGFITTAEGELAYDPDTQEGSGQELGTQTSGNAVDEANRQEINIQTRQDAPEPYQEIGEVSNEEISRHPSFEASDQEINEATGNPSEDGYEFEYSDDE
ncbi:hypothetical protein PSN45_002211 [Yamadazyma tenuis]|uniref:uncharacterized protein n=1 Tax=Candida tenuis TaxID=2315449 RepID=UPI00279F405A|nr:hypothetical protein PSN45_002211 [Yamadazyma tenuis]